jgi:epoxyqueuosine reductase
LSNEDILKNVYSELEKHQCKGKLTSAGNVKKLEEKFITSHQRGDFDEVFYQRELVHFDFKIPQNNAEWKSIIVVAVPQPHVRITFHPNGEPFPCIVPSTYSHKTDDFARKVIESVLSPIEYRLEAVQLPLKSLAVHCGLAEYGRNNISYVKGLGSFNRLVAFYSDFPCLKDDWREPKVMERCEKCTVCQKMCPTGAIPTDRFLLRAERCITFHNESAHELPNWLDPVWHRCLVGCLICQKTCPVDREFVDNIEDGPTFSPAETDLILKDTPEYLMPAETLAKFKEMDLMEYWGLLGRNLQLLFDNRDNL